MFALMTGRRSPGQAEAFGSARPTERGVLPRWLRRPVRLFARLGTGDFVPPRHAALTASSAVIAGFVLYGTWLGGHFPAVAEAVTARSGFAVDQIRVVGHRETSEIDVVDRLELSGWTSLIGFDVDAARERIATLPWVEKVAVRKIYPNALEVRIDERKPFAVWQHGRQLSVIEETGNVIAPFQAGRQSGLPLVVGDGAQTRAAAMLTTMQSFPEIAGRVRGYIRVGDRRWNLRLTNGMTVKLPEFGMETALAEFRKLDDGEAVSSRDVAAVDMRLPGRVTLKLSQQAFEARQVDVKKLGRKMKPGART